MRVERPSIIGLTLAATYGRKLASIVVVLVLLIGVAPVAATGPTAPPSPPVSAGVDPQVVDELGASPLHSVTFIVVLHEPIFGDPLSAVDSQMALEGVLASLQRLGTVSDHIAYYGANATVVTGGRAAINFLAAWPSVAAIRAYQAGHPQETAPSPPDSAEATGQITGVVTGPDGTTPLSGIKVTAYRQTGAVTWSVAGTTTTSGAGTYSLGELVTGVYRVKFESLSGAHVTEYYNNKTTFNLADSVNVTDGQTTPNINASLALAGSIAGHVTSATSGDGIGDIVVGAWISDGGVWRQVNSAVTNGDGNYTISGLAGATAYRVKFSDGLAPPRYLDEYYDNVATIEQATPVPVTAGQVTANINASLAWSLEACYFADVQPNADHNNPESCDNDVDVADVQRVAGCWQQPVGAACPGALDFNQTGTIELADLVTVAQEWGWPNF